MIVRVLWKETTNDHYGFKSCLGITIKDREHCRMIPGLFVSGIAYENNVLLSNQKIENEQTKSTPFGWRNLESQSDLLNDLCVPDAC